MTQRLFKLKGNLETLPTTGSVKVNGTEVFNGTFSEGGTTESGGFLCEFAYTIDDSAGTDTELPIVVTVDTGTAFVGMLKYNYAQIANPALTAEELAYVTAGTTSSAPAEIKADVLAKGGWYIRDETAFAYGLTTELTYDNRTTEFVDGVALPEEAGHLYIKVTEGSVLTFTTIVFSSVDPPLPPKPA
jgi:hypothetical protein